MTLFVVGVGGAIGAIARYLLGGWIQTASGSAFPWGTFSVNVSGSVLFGLAIVLLPSMAATAEARQLITVGFLGSFTTFSTFSYEAFALLREGQALRAGAYMAGSLVVGLAGVALGAALASMLARGESA